MSPILRIGAIAALLVLASLRLAGAVEVRQPEPIYKTSDGSHNGMYYGGDLARAYAPCLAPNDVASDGTPACSPAVTSACPFVRAFLSISSEPRGTPFFDIGINGLDPFGVCDGDYVLEIVVRATVDPYDDELPSCSAGRCTFQDVVIRKTLDLDGRTAGFLDELPSLNIREGNFEIRGATVIAPDGLPLAAVGLAPLGSARHVSSFLSLPYPACTTPDPDGAGFACNATTPTTPCDFESGRLTWDLAPVSRLPTLHARLEDVAGSSPLCASGPYVAAPTLRTTADVCGGSTVRCTLVDTVAAFPLTMKGRDVDTVVTLPAAPVSMQLLESRVIDPTGATLATVAVANTRRLAKAKVDVKGRDLRLRASYPPTESPDQFIDPTAGPTTITVTNHGHALYSVTIPGNRWQLGVPLGTRWDYADPGGVLGGVRMARIKRSPQGGIYDVQLRVSDVDLSAVDFPSVDVVVGLTGTPG